MPQELYQKECSRCKAVQIIDNFPKETRRKGGRGAACNQCVRQSRLTKQCSCGALMCKYRSKQCGACYRANRSGDKNPKWKGGIPRCIDCARTLSRYDSIRCQPCYRKSDARKKENNCNWKGGKPNCVDCGKQLSTRKVQRCYVCAGKQRSGPNSGVWKGGITVKTRGERHSGKVTAWRKVVLERDGHQCRLCGSPEHLQVHHIKEWKYYEHLRTDPNNGITLCADCHLNTIHQGNHHNPPLHFWTIKAMTVPLLRLKLNA